MQEYTTQMDAARKGIITKEMETVAKKEQLEVQELRRLMAEGRCIIPCNKLHTCIEPAAIGASGDRRGGGCCGRRFLSVLCNSG